MGSTKKTLKRKGATHLACAFFGEAVHEDKDLYVEALKTARMSADMTGWTRLMLAFIGRSAVANLDRLPRPHGFYVSCLPVKISGASAGWCRAVAFVPEPDAGPTPAT